MVPVEVERLWPGLAALAVKRVVVVDDLGPWWDGMGIHRHRIPTLLVAVGGAARIEVGERRRVDLVQGEAVLLHSWVWHSHPVLHSGAALNFGWTHRQGDTTVFWPGGDWEGSLPRALVERSLEEMVAAPAERHCALARQLLAAVAALPPRPCQMPTAMRTMAVYAWIHRTRPITAATLLASSGLGYTAANRLFSHWLGFSPKQYLLNCRLELARRLLAAGLPPGEVWSECGFRNRADLTRRFRLAHGVSPRRWAVQARSI